LPAQAWWFQVGGKDQFLMAVLALHMKGLHERRGKRIFRGLVTLGATLAFTIAVGVGTILVRLVVAARTVDIFGVAFMLKHHRGPLVRIEFSGFEEEDLLLC